MAEIIENRIILYTSSEGKTSVNVVFKEETFWLTQKALAELFGVDRTVITKHLKNIFSESELEENSVCAIFAHTAQDGKNYNTKYYNLDAIIAVGYRVNSKEATRFRKWATQTLKEYIIKGFAINDEMLKNGRAFGRDYFDELLEKIREIRASERRAYQKIADVFEQCSYDYDKNSETTRTFYAFVQNKLHYAITGKTAAELIVERVNCEHPTMGLTNWKNSPEGKILKSDITIAKNYLNEKELSRMNRIVTMFIDYAELQAEDGILMSMQDWVDETDRFLANNRRRVLQGTGQVSHESAVDKATKEYEKFRIKQDERYISQFDIEMEKYLKGGE
ncbi:MAG: virulence RhuM family protein [Bacillota bacterium]|nr:virulence RhuM family protein [Bacillota bacterium]